MSPKLLTVFGATGNQGGSVIKAILAHPTLSKEYTLRGITRDTSKPAAQALQSQGVETVKADLNDPASLRGAINGSHAVFAVTNYWESSSKDVEHSQGVNITDVSIDSGVKHLIWSSLPNVTKLTNGTLKKVHHFDSKAGVEDYIRSKTSGGSSGMIATFFMPGFFMSNIKGSIRPGQDGAPTFAQPWDANATHVPLLDVRTDTGKFVAGILASDPSAVDGKNIQGTSQWATPQEIVDTVSKYGGSGQEVKFASVPESMFINFLPAPVAEELTQNMVLIRDFSYFGKEAPEKQSESNKVLEKVGKPVSWREFVEGNGPWKW